MKLAMQLPEALLFLHLDCSGTTPPMCDIFSALTFIVRGLYLFSNPRSPIPSQCHSRLQNPGLLPFHVNNVPPLPCPAVFLQRRRCWTRNKLCGIGLMRLLNAELNGVCEEIQFACSRYSIIDTDRESSGLAAVIKVELIGDEVPVYIGAIPPAGYQVIYITDHIHSSHQPKFSLGSSIYESVTSLLTAESGTFRDLFNQHLQRQLLALTEKQCTSDFDAS
uniref:GSKIP domain-containing protein n=1 Tax=Spongospora subterranea TaxID=70186 RepID=A0A0H5R575_9EUKA|eukprot:CRZ03277.1 hypothetical protein [Spongospora subterranea]